MGICRDSDDYFWHLFIKKVGMLANSDMQKKMLLAICIGIFLIGFVSISADGTSTYSIPNWIKNTAGWWSEDKIGESEFLKGIQYLVDNLILEIPANQKILDSGKLKLDNYSYNLPVHNNLETKAKISGKFAGQTSTLPVTMEITRPDGKIDEQSTRSTGKFELTYVIKSDFPLGDYQVSVKNIHNVKLGPIMFKLEAAQDNEQKLVPAWVKNNAGWWASDIISDEEFVNALQFLVKEGIIKLQKKEINVESTFAPSIDPDLIMYQTKISSNAEPFSVILVYTTHNDYCSIDEKRKATYYGKMSEWLLNKNLRENPTQVIAVCMKLDEITEKSYPLVLKELGANKSLIMIFVGDVKANFETYNDRDALGTWTCIFDYSSKYSLKGCSVNLIVVCDECVLDSYPKFGNIVEGGMWALSHEIAHYNLFEEGYGYNIFAGKVHLAQTLFDKCQDNNILESEACSKLIEPAKILEKIYPVMNINFVINQWKELDSLAIDIDHLISPNE